MFDLNNVFRSFLVFCLMLIGLMIMVDSLGIVKCDILKFLKLVMVILFGILYFFVISWFWILNVVMLDM